MKEQNFDHTFQVRAADGFIGGLQQLMETRQLTLEEAYTLAVQDALNSSSHEIIPFIEAAYNCLLNNPDYTIK